jgi:hypothetical protein
VSASSADTSSPDPSVAAAPSSLAAADSISPTINTNYRATFISLLAGAVGLVAVGQQIFTRGLNSRVQGTPFIGAGMFSFVLAYRMYATSRVPEWLDVAASRLRVLPHQLILLMLSVCCAVAAQLFAGDQWRMLNLALGWGMWIAALALAVAGSYRAESDEDAVPAVAWNRVEVAAVAALFVIAFVIRAASNGGLPAALTGDEGSAGLAAVNWLDGKLDNPFVVGWYSFPSLYFAVPAASIAVWGYTYQALRMPSALAGALTVVGLYWLARPLFGRAAAGLGSALLAAHNFHIHFSRVGLNNIWDGFFMAAVLGAFWRGWQTGRRVYFVGAGLLLGLSQYFYTSARIIPLVILAWLALIAITDRPSLRRRAPDLLYTVVVAVVTFLPLAIFYVPHPAEFSAPMNRVSIFSRNWLEVTSAATHTPIWQLLLNNFRDAALAFTSMPLRAWYTSGQPMLLALPSALFILGLLLAVFNYRDTRYWLLLLWLAGVVGIAALTESTPAAQRYIIAAPAATLLAGIALATMAEWVIQVWPDARLAMYGAVIAATAMAMTLDVRFYFSEYIPARGSGDANTQVASQLGRYLADYPEGAQVFFFGPPRMGYRGFSTIPFLAPQVKGEDVTKPWDAAPDWQITGSQAAFVFLPEREKELDWVRSRYPGGTLQWFYANDGKRLFLLYELRISP